MTQKTLRYTQKNEIHSMILNLCHRMELPLHYNRKGKKIFTNYQRVALIMLFHRSGKSLRDFARELYESLWPKWLGLKEIPGKSTIHDWMKLFKLETVRKLHLLLTEKQEPTLTSIDATGIDSWKRSRHYAWRIGDTYLPYVKLDALVDVDTKVILDYNIRVKPRHDVVGAASIFKRTRLKDTLILADRGYDSEPLHIIAREKGNAMYAPPRKWSKKRPKGRFRRKCVEKHQDYGMRNISESVFHTLKAVHVSALRSRISFMKKRELAWNIMIYNMNRIILAWLSWINRFIRTEPVV